MTTRRRQLVVTAIAVAVVTATLSIWTVASRARTPAQWAAEAAPPPPSELTAVVENGPLSDAFALDGKLSYQSRLSIEGPAVSGGRSIVTDLLVKRGDRVDNRRLVAAVSGRPLITLKGKFASYRDLRLGDVGPDVRQLRLALGLWGDDVYDRATAASVARLYGEAGYPTPADTAVDNAESAPSASDSARSEAIPPTRAKPAAPVPGGLLPMNEIVFVPTLPATVVEVTAAIGGKGDEPLLTVASGGWQITATVTEDQRIEFQNLPADTSMTINGGPANGKGVTLAGIKTVEPSGQDQTSYEAIFTIAAKSGEGMTEGMPISLQVVRQESPAEAVVVPVSALWTKPGGRTEVRLRSVDSKMMIVPVTVLFVVDGRAAVTGPAELAAGVRVAIGSRNGDLLD
ncbi:hypothetical protein [Salinispora cortesiana]|uniref:hypothetical protein n=1 Tax=Salinispora cortesiana TaxID=1305843 RepID=UPI0012BCABBD|nr:hypothetical protein [Salinispora cortesiana]